MATVAAVESEQGATAARATAGLATGVHISPEFLVSAFGLAMVISKELFPLYSSAGASPTTPSLSSSHGLSQPNTNPLDGITKAVVTSLGHMEQHAVASLTAHSPRSIAVAPAKEVRGGGGKALNELIRHEPVKQGPTSIYIVQGGDTIFSIARRLGVSPIQIETLNPQIKNFSVIRPGDKLTIPSIPEKVKETDPRSLQIPPPAPPSPPNTSSSNCFDGRGPDGNKIPAGDPLLQPGGVPFRGMNNDKGEETWWKCVGPNEPGSINGFIQVSKPKDTSPVYVGPGTFIGGPASLLALDCPEEGARTFTFPGLDAQLVRGLRLKDVIWPFTIKTWLFNGTLEVTCNDHCVVVPPSQVPCFLCLWSLWTGGVIPKDTDSSKPIIVRFRAFNETNQTCSNRKLVPFAEEIIDTSRLPLPKP